jgi:hypothetical protein
LNSVSRRSQPGYREAVANIKTETRKRLSLPEDVAISVSELSCSDPGCPDVETVIALLKAGEKPRVFRIHKSIIEISIPELQALIDGS